MSEMCTMIVPMASQVCLTEGLFFGKLAVAVLHQMAHALEAENYHMIGAATPAARCRGGP